MRLLKLLVLLSFAVFAGTMFSTGAFTSRVQSNSFGPPAGFTGAPGEETCSDCHLGLSGAGNFGITVPPAYVPGKTYPVTIRHESSDLTRLKWGFQVTSLAVTDAAGTFQSTDLNTQIVSQADRRYIEHTAEGSFPNQTRGASWTFNWTAPGDDMGTVIFYGAGNQANFNGNSDGDHIYAATATTVSAEPATIQGRVLTADGRPLRGATVTLRDSVGSRFSVLSSSLGFYSFDGIAIGQRYTILVSSKRFRFSPLDLTLQGDRTADFNGQE